YRGRPVIVNFWASWCIPCRDEFPQFVAARAEHAADGLEILGVVHQDGADTASAFARDHDAGWPMLMDTADAAWQAYRVLGVPSPSCRAPGGPLAGRGPRRGPRAAWAPAAGPLPPGGGGGAPGAALAGAALAGAALAGAALAGAALAGAALAGAALADAAVA